MEKDVIVAIVLISISTILIAFVLIAYFYQKKQNADTQREISDQDLLRMIFNEPDQLISPHQLRDKTGVTLNQARGRLSALMTYGLLSRSHNKSARYFYSLQSPLEELPPLSLSSDPFLTVEDLLQIFEAYNYRVTPQNLIMATGLPLAVIKREMKYFEKQGIVQKLQRANQSGMMMERFFVLQDPYRGDPDRFRAKAGVLDLEMREILRNDNLIV
jgi:ribosomal protein S25